jgi:hypothetical protein
VVNKKIDRYVQKYFNGTKNMTETNFSSFPVLHSPPPKTFDIDIIVRQIITDITVTQKQTTANKKTVAKTSFPSDIKNSKDNIEKPVANEIYIDSRVISLAELKEHLGTATKLFISSKSILTPSAKDEIKKRKIEIAIKLPLQEVQANPVIWFAFHKSATFPIRLLNLLQKNFFLKQESFVALTELLDTAEQQLSHKTTCGVALTKQFATAIRLANQRNIIRAIGCVDPKQSIEDATEINANLLVIHPERVSDTKIFEIIKQLKKL